MLSRSTLSGASFSLMATYAMAMPSCTASPDSGPDSEQTSQTASAVTVGQWQWLDVPNSHCGNGQQTGFAYYSPSTNVTDLLIYLEGGGACADPLTCYGNAGGGNDLFDFPVTTSYFQSGYDSSKFESIFPFGPDGGIFNRSTSSNSPYKDSGMIYVPYCTGDLHSGAAIQQWSSGSAYFMGRANIDLYKTQFRSLFPGATHVTLTGSSAGGFGAVLNYDRIAQAFAGTQVDLVTDSAPFLWQEKALLPIGFGAWQTATGLPPDCTACSTSKVAAIYSFLSGKYPASSFALLEHSKDFTMSAVYGDAPYPDYYYALGDFTQNTIGRLPNWRYFVVDDSNHTLLESIVLSSGGFAPATLNQKSANVHCNWVLGVCFPNGYTNTVLADWLTFMRKGSSSWKNSSPIPPT